MAALTPAQQSSYSDLINSGKATPINNATPDVKPPDFSTGGLTITPSTPRGLMPVANAATYSPSQLGDPAKWNITPSQTVSGQLDSVLANDSLPMQRARTQGLQLASSRGLLNSSMAVGAAQDSLISAALPIAQSDATANLGVNRYNVDTANNFSTINTKSQNDANAFNAQQTNATDQFNTGNKFTREEATRANDRATTMANFEANVKASLAQINNEATTNQNTQLQVSKMASDFMAHMEAINRDTNMDQQSKDYSINQLYGSFKSSISLISAVGAVPNVADLLTDGGAAKKVDQSAVAVPNVANPSVNGDAARFKLGIDALFKQDGVEAANGSFKQGVAELLKQKGGDPVSLKQGVVELLNQRKAGGGHGPFLQEVDALLKRLGGGALNV